MIFSSILAFTLGLYFVILQYYYIELQFSPSMIGMLMSVSGLSAAISTLPLGIVADRVGRRKVVFGSALFMGF